MPLPSHPSTGSPDPAEATETALRDVFSTAGDVRRQIIARASAELLDWCFRVRAGPSSPDADDAAILGLAAEIGLVRRTLDLAGDAGTSAGVTRLLADLDLADPADDAAAIRLAEETARSLAAGDWSLLMKGQRR